MGALFGRIREETPEYDLVDTLFDGKVEIRNYHEQWRATVDTKDLNVKPGQKKSSAAFWALAKYIGVLSKPENKTSEGSTESISMTAPVIMEEDSQAIAMTAPVVTENSSGNKDMKMSFILPSKFIKNGRTPPTPMNPAVKIEKVPAETVAVKTFSGFLWMSRCERKVKQLIEDLKILGKYGFVTDKEGNPIWTARGYNAPFVIPCFRTNEVTVKVQ